MMGNILSQMRRFNESATYFDRAIQINPEYKLIYDGQFNAFIRQAIDLDRTAKYIPADAILNQAVVLHNGDYSGNNNVLFFK